MAHVCIATAYKIVLYWGEGGILFNGGGTFDVKIMS